MSVLLIFAHFLFFGERCEQFAHNRSFFLSNVSESLRSPTKNKLCERIAQVAHQKWATKSDSLTSLRGNEQPWANHSGRSPKMSEWVNRSFFVSKSLIRSFLDKKLAICSEIKWANSQPWCKLRSVKMEMNSFLTCPQGLKLKTLKIRLLFLVWNIHVWAENTGSGVWLFMYLEIFRLLFFSFAALRDSRFVRHYFIREYCIVNLL